ncbi:serine/threonine-protein phosphatase 7 long form-like protein [Trifolium pratense]|uniref:Serine/threonine-protein phosphatase 7 long form-like protein n=1 Tax=Trifolium pratense TaxID=57577 RepID=A0A2K3M3Y9_TRIPR|nr:serine/threonine-protein phosphatase 7 long form-like protein [Trifolium pratense]
MQEAQPEPEAEQAMDDEAEVEDLLEFHSPFEGHLDPRVFLGGPSDNCVLTEYGGHIARSIYENINREVISIVRKRKKLTNLNKLVPTNEEWWDQTIRATRMSGLANTGFSFLDRTPLASFVDRWHRETSNFHIPGGEITVTLDDVCGPIKVWYLLEKDPRQFGYVQTIPRLPHNFVHVNTSLRQIDNQFVHFMDRVLTSHMLGTRDLHP